jgi:hypothetical protein
MHHDPLVFAGRAHRNPILITVIFAAAAAAISPALKRRAAAWLIQPAAVHSQETCMNPLRIVRCPYRALRYTAQSPKGVHMLAYHAELDEPGTPFWKAQRRHSAVWASEDR